jgi:protein gp37
MATESSIEWTNATWNPVTGCTRASAGCDNCYAVTMTHRLEAMGQSKYAGLTVLNPRGDRHFNGVVRCHDDALQIPLRWKKPRRVFVNSMSDLFHKDVPSEFIYKVFAVMALTPQHTYQILTKRPDLMAEKLSEIAACDLAIRTLADVAWDTWDKAVAGELEKQDIKDNPRSKNGGEQFTPKFDAYWTKREQVWGEIEQRGWPLPNVWLGTSVENQKAADERIPHLLKCPAAVRFLSCEPLLGPVDLSMHLGIAQNHEDLRGLLSWVIIGGESGPGARLCNVEWIGDIVEDCKRAAVPVFVKQLGADAVTPRTCGQSKFHSYQHWVDKAYSWMAGMGCQCFDTHGNHCRSGKEFIEARDNNRFPITICNPLNLKDSKGGDMAEWPEELRVREFPQQKASL